MSVPHAPDAARLFFQRRPARSGKVIFGQNGRLRLKFEKSFMLSFARRAAICFCRGLFLMLPAAVFAQTNYYSANGTEYSIVGSLPGDQAFPDAALTTNGGFVVWQDNVTDGSGWGVSAMKLDGTLSGSGSPFRVNVQGTNDQEYPRVALLKSGGAAFVWQGGVEGYQHIYARFLNSSNTFLTTTDIVVSTFTNRIGFQINPAIATLNDSNVVVVFGSFDQAGSNSMQDVYGQIFSPTGHKIGTNFLINQFTSYNQRTPAIAPLKSGGFVAAWVSEQERTVAPALGNNSSTYYTASTIVTPSVDIYARLYSSNGVAQGNEFLVNTDSNPCANPDVAAAADGSFMITWDAFDMADPTNSLDIYARSFTSTGVGGAVVLVNSYTYGDQYVPRISAIAGDYLIVWTSLGQDGSREGVFGQFVHAGGSLVGSEFLVNTTTAGQQMQPAVASDGASQFLAVWTGFNSAVYNFDLYAQRYANVASVLQPMAAPFVWAPFTLSNGVYQPQLTVLWPTLLGLSISNYEVYVDGAETPMALVASNQVVNGQNYQWTMTASNGLTAGTTHTFQLDYVTTSGQRPLLSPPATGTTWSGNNWGGIPDEWMTNYFGGNTNLWPAATADSDGSGLSNLEDFWTGSNPTNPATALHVQLSPTPQGMFLSWPTTPGLTYQVQVKTNLMGGWTDLGSPRFAAGTSDSIFVGGASAGYYQVMCLY
ncbi:MAG TPA: hypothetical protein VMD27_03375 [Candidatus Aquilonibacter sp.]|nr:hypothetical protein [Candidatus Aquilonibacter sp.]